MTTVIVITFCQPSELFISVRITTLNFILHTVKCGCGPNYYYVPRNFINDTVNANATIEQLPSLFYNSINFIDVLQAGNKIAMKIVNK